MTPICNSYFTGGGLMDIGLQQAGIQLQQSLDIDGEATGVMSANPHYFGHKILTEDITGKTVLDQPQCDMMSFTYPCTEYSTAADINKSRTGEDLYLHAFRHMILSGVEMFVAENVPGLKKFKVVMEAMTKLPHYYVTVICPVKASYWLPQDRNRLIIIGTKKPFFITPPNQITNRPRIKDILEVNPEVEMPDYVISRLKGKYRDKPIIVDPDQPGAIAPCCVAHYAKDLGTRLVKDKKAKHGVRPFSIREYARLQGVPDDYVLPNKRSSYKIIGNGVPVPMARWVGIQAMKYFN
jgi:DNA (cytosine-5)-methyltransferase 1